MTRKERKEIREAVANYMQSEGCSCCGDYDQHAIDSNVLGKLLKATQYDDKSGYDFSKYKSKGR